jgi:hypothetical protein
LPRLGFIYLLISENEAAGCFIVGEPSENVVVGLNYRVNQSIFSFEPFLLFA